MEQRRIYELSGQSQLFEHFDQLTLAEKDELLSNLKKYSPENLKRNCKAAIKLAKENSEDSAVIQPLPQSSYRSLIENPNEIEEYQKIGIESIRDGEVAVILMAGGQGTRLGSSAPKGCYDIGLPSHKSLFQIQAEKLKKLESLAGCSSPIYWYIMTSEPTRNATECFFNSNNYFGLKSEQVIFFNQGTLPAFDLNGDKLLLSSSTRLVESPNGNGGLYQGIRDNDLLNDFKSKGIKHIHMYCVDNVVVKIADPVFVGFAIRNKFKLATKVVRKRDACESVGLIATKDGRPCVIEYSEISKELAESVDNTGLLKFRAANIVNHYYSVELLENKIDEWCECLPYHIAKKKIPFYNNLTNQYFKPTEPNGIKLEQFIFDVFPTVDLSEFGCLEVEREKEFAPLKNASGTINDNPETSRQAYMALGTQWLRNAGAKISRGALVEVSNKLSYAGENLDIYSGREFSDQQILEL